MLGKQLIALGIDGLSIKIMIASMLAMRAVCQNICISISRAWDTVASLKMFKYHLLIRPMARTLKSEMITGREL